MRIALRTSGGRGEYELAGKQGSVHASDLFNKELCYELTPSIVLPGRAVATRVQGKPRIRLEDQQTTTHLYRLLAGILLLPKPKREFKQTHGAELLKREAYSMTAIKVDVGDVQGDKAVIRPTDILLENADKRQDKIVFAHRMGRIAQLWERAKKHSGLLATLVQQHMQAVLQPVSDHKEIEDRADAIAKALKTTGDPLPFAEKALGITEHVPIRRKRDRREVEPTLEDEFAEDDLTSPVEAKRERVKQWRQVALRGAAGVKFRTAVTKVYGFQCLFSGQRLPKTEATDSPGVDAAHILPWSTHNINSITNGLCLNKLCHWALDAGVVRLDFDASCSEYVLQVPDEVRRAATKAKFDLEYFERLEGRIPKARLPKNQKCWPSAAYLDELNQFMFSGSS